MIKRKFWILDLYIWNYVPWVKRKLFCKRGFLIRWNLTPTKPKKRYYSNLNNRVYRFRHVLMIQKFTAMELKPHLWNNDDLWKKIWHFKHWKSLHSYHVAPILAFKSSSQYGYLEGFKWPMLWNLSLIFIIMRIHEKILDTLSTGNLCTATPLWFFQYGSCADNSST